MNLSVLLSNPPQKVLDMPQQAIDIHNYLPVEAKTTKEIFSKHKNSSLRSKSVFVIDEHGVDSRGSMNSGEDLSKHRLKPRVVPSLTFKI